MSHPACFNSLDPVDPCIAAYLLRGLGEVRRGTDAS